MEHYEVETSLDMAKHQDNDVWPVGSTFSKLDERMRNIGREVKVIG